MFTQGRYVRGSFTRSRVSVLAGLLLVAVLRLAGCGADGSGGANLLTTLQLEPGHQVDFYELQAVGLSIAESGQVGVHHSVLTEELAGKSMVEVYRKLAPQAVVPQQLLDADQRFAGRVEPAPQNQPGLVPETATNGSGSKIYSDGEQRWFHDTYCIHQAYRQLGCSQGWDWGEITGHSWDQLFHTVAMQGSEGSAPIPSLVQYWESGHWNFWIQDWISPGKFVRRDNIYYSTPHDFRFSIGRAGAGVQVSLVAVLECIAGRPCNYN